MADYRLSAKVISRGNGQSAVASAAYRHAARLNDLRTGEIHDYSRKQGVVHSAILAPDDAPDWMRDRGQLWTAVEAAEKRRDAQLAREVQLSLPHELTDDQRRELVETFAREQFVGRGMIADLAIHAPGKDGDDRNHHAHIMLTMRSLTGEGFGNKVRDWNDSAVLEQWREQWAHHQNRALERYGHEARVDHRSYADQGIDREPTQHMGPTAADMENKGKPSRIGDENREIDDRNADRAQQHGQAAVINLAIEREKRNFVAWANHSKRETEHAQAHDRLDLAQRHDRQRANLERDLKALYGPHKATIAQEAATVDRRMQATGLRRMVRQILGRQQRDEKARRDLTATLRSIEQREREQRQALEVRLSAEKDRQADRQAQRRSRQEEGIEKARSRREREGWTPLRGKERMEAPRQRSEAPTPLKTPKPRAAPDSEPYPAPRMKPAGFPEPPARSAVPQHDPATAEAVERSIKQRQSESEGRSSADNADSKPSISAPWDSAIFGRKNPWESDLFREPANDRGRERSPRDDAPKPPKEPT